MRINIRNNTFIRIMHAIIKNGSEPYVKNVKAGTRDLSKQILYRNVIGIFGVEAVDGSVQFV